MKFISGFKSLLFFRPSQVVNKDLIDRASDLRKNAYASSAKGRVFRQETFRDAVERLSLTREQLERRRKELMIQSRVWYGLCAFSLLYSFYLGLNGSMVGVIGALCIGLLIAFVSGFVSAFRVHQIDCEELFSFQDFLKDSGGWLK